MLALGYTLAQLAKAINQLREEGIDGIIVGGTCIHITLRRSELEEDVDLFVTSLSPFIEEERIRSTAYRRGWRVGLTELGTVSLILNIEGNEIQIELYENVHDFYIPDEALRICRRSISIHGVDINYIAPECWAVFKAKRGSNQDMYALSKLHELAELGEIKLDISLMKKVAGLYEDEARYIFDRLRSAGFRL